MMCELNEKNSKMNLKCMSWEAILPNKDEERKITFNIFNCMLVCRHVHLCLCTWEEKR